MTLVNNPLKKRRKSATALYKPSAQPAGCVPGFARLLNGDVRECDTNIGQSPDPG